MTAKEYLNALEKALSILPEEERENAMRYYQDYFLDAGTENEQQVIKELGDPNVLAAEILRDYGGMTTTNVPKTRKTRRGWPVWLVVLIGICAVIGAPIAGALGVGGIVLVLGLIIGVIALVFGGAVALAALPLALLVGGAALIVFAVLAIGKGIATFVATLGLGLTVLAVGGLIALLVIKLVTGLSTPIFSLIGTVMDRFIDLVHRLCRKLMEVLRR
ncbi:MAG: DUF1700 domain-containing protein [Butyricicoccus sp.]|nr:DUF1700 domain-containing protein [Butyricicoccus sp.]